MMTLSAKAMHAWDVSVDEAKAIQEMLAHRVQELPLPGPIRTVAGIDVSFPEQGIARASVVVLSFPDQVPQRQVTAEQPVRFPYVPGLLSFREVPVVLEAIRKLESTPDVLICDAHGRAHFRRLGLASHLGLLLDHPTIGCAKSRLVGTFQQPAPQKGERTLLMEGEEVLGAVLRTRTGVRPVFVSIGHRIDLQTAIEVVLVCATRYRLPEPTRLAHHAAAGTLVVPSVAQRRLPSSAS